MTGVAVVAAALRRGRSLGDNAKREGEDMRRGLEVSGGQRNGIHLANIINRAGTVRQREVN
jgi:hypothetical protein